LGGPDHIAAAPKVVDGDGKQAMGADGYFYFGAARELPGVRELFEKIIPDTPKRARFDLYKCIDADYYGFRDDDDGLLEKLEKLQENLARGNAERDQQKNKRQKVEPEEKEDDDAAPDVYKSHVPLPTQEEIEKLIVEKRREELLAKLEEDEEFEELEESLNQSESNEPNPSDNDQEQSKSSERSTDAETSKPSSPTDTPVQTAS